MPSPSSTHDRREGWRLVDGKATLEDGAVAARIDLGNVAAGLCDVTIHGEPAGASHLFGVHLAEPCGEPDDVYVRGGDLVATYAESAIGRVRPQIYVRRSPLESDGCLSAIELVVSSQTSLLDARPQTTLVSRLTTDTIGMLAANEVVGGPSTESDSFTWRDRSTVAAWAGGRGAGSELFLFRSDGAAQSIGLMIFPSDDDGAVARFDDDQAELRFRLFDHPLEKGVIRRGRALALIVARDNDEQTVKEHYRRWLETPPPLTV